MGRVTNSDNVENWTRLIRNITFLNPSIIRWNNGDPDQYSKFTHFVKVLSKNWSTSLPNILRTLEDHQITVDDFFNLEQKVCYGFSSLLNDVNILQKEILKDKNMDISVFIAKVSHAFLPSVVFQLEEYGLPRMISKKIQYYKLMNFEDQNLALHKALNQLKIIGKEKLVLQFNEHLLNFDYYIIDYFYDGIKTNRQY